MSSRVLVPVADGSEEIEACTLTDVLRRAGAEVVVASVAASLEVTCAHKLKFVADKMIADCAADQFSHLRS